MLKNMPDEKGKGGGAGGKGGTHSTGPRKEGSYAPSPKTEREKLHVPGQGPKIQIPTQQPTTTPIKKRG
jgi:hypothetical protein